MQILVVSHRGVAVSPARSVSFGADGGSIGRADSSTLVLDDPERTVSRVHAQVLCRGDRFFIVDRGSNPLMCNGHPLGAGNEAALQNGDRLSIGSFELSVQGIGAATQPPLLGAMPAQAHATSTDDPFADLLVGLESPSPHQVAPAHRSTSDPIAATPGRSPLFDDPMSAASAPAHDPFADLLGTPASGAAIGHSTEQLGDFSDLAMQGGGSSSSLDQLFGLGVPTGAADPLALSPLADPLLHPNTAQSADPMVALNSRAQSSAPARSDHVAALNQAYTAPLARPASPTRPAPGSEDFSDLLASPVAHVSPPPAKAVLSRVDVGLASAPRQSSPTPAALPTSASVGTPDASELMAAFLRGVGSTHQMPQTMTPELMERIGVILRGATEGTLQLLLSRQEFKREVRAEVTVIGAQRNNPLKFSPTAEVALAHLLGPGIRGFMRPDEAMQDAFNDLRAHQFGVMVGLHAGLEHVLARFTPQALEQRLTEKTALDALFSASRKAKLWDQFCALHASISQEAEDDFHNLFGKAFSQAYDEQMARFKAAG